MTRSILRVVLTTLALVLLFAGSLNLKRTSAQDMEVEGANACSSQCGCGGGPTVCCKIQHPNGPLVYCGMPNPD